MGAHPIPNPAASRVPGAGILLLEGTETAGGSRRRKRRRENPLCPRSLRSPPPDFGITTDSRRNFQGFQKTGMFWSVAGGPSWPCPPSLGLRGFEPQTLPLPLSKFSPIPAESKPCSCWPGAASSSLEMSQTTLEPPGAAESVPAHGWGGTGRHLGTFSIPIIPQFHDFMSSTSPSLEPPQ